MAGRPHARVALCPRIPARGQASDAPVHSGRVGGHRICFCEEEEEDMSTLGTTDTMQVAAGSPSS
eukprot:3129637-Rhodomonas_salina.2